MDKGKKIVSCYGSGDGNRSKCCAPIYHNRARILLCDWNSTRCEEDSTLFCRYFFEVTSVWSPIEAIDALKCERTQIDIIIAGADILMANNAKMLNYILHDKELKHIPVFRLLPQYEDCVTEKEMSLGIVDSLVKPLQASDMANLWAHIWLTWTLLPVAGGGLYGGLKF